MSLPMPRAGMLVESQNAALAAEIGANLLPLPEILKRYGLTKQELKALLLDPQFRHEVKDFKRKWHSPLSAKERIRLKALLAVEDGMADVYAIFCDTDANPSVRLDAYNKLVQLADAAPRKEDTGGGGSGFSISITIPPADDGPARTMTLEHNPDADEAEDSD